ncbi:MAG: pilus assembly protein PilM [bacterium]
MPQTVLGIDLGSYSVKIAQVERGFGEFKLSHFYEVPLVAEEVLTYEQSASAALTKFFQENSINYDACVVSLPGTLASFRSLTMPFGNIKKIDQTLEFELETLIPFDIEEVLFDYTVLSNSPQESKVLAAYVKEADFKRFLGQIQTSGVDPRYVGVDTIDLSYLSFPGFLPPEGQYALLDLGHQKSNLMILEGNKIKGLRCFSWGGHHITKAIAKALDLPYEKAEAWKHGKAQVAASSEDPGLQAVHAAVEDLQQQIKQTLFAFYESGEKPLEALYLSGGTSRLQGLDTFFSSRLNINVSQLDVLDDAFTELHDREGARHVIPTAFAEALRAVYPNKGAKINFRRGDYAYKKDIEQLGGTLKRVGIVAASVAALAIGYFIIAYMTLSSQVDKMNKGVAKMVKASVPDLPKGGTQGAKQVVTLLDGKISAINEKLKRVEGEGTVSSLELLKMVSAAMPPRDELVVDIDDMNIAPERVRMEGRTVSYEGVDKVKASMEKVKIFKNVQTGNVRKGVRDEIKFSLSFDVVTGA